jgi:hypothetical protein
MAVPLRMQPFITFSERAGHSVHGQPTMPVEQQQQAAAVLIWAAGITYKGLHACKMAFKVTAETSEI